MLAAILIGLVLVLGLFLAVLVLFFVLPLRVGAAGFYREAGYNVSGFARGWGGLCGAVCEFDERGLQVRVVLGCWTVWRPKEKYSAGDAEVDISAEPERDTRTKKADAAAAAKPSYWSRCVQAKQHLRYAAAARPILMRFVTRVSKMIQFQRAALDLELGVGDPAFTGRLFGYVEAFKRVVGKRVRISLTPDFVQPRFAGSGSLRFSIYLYRLLFAALALAARGGFLGAKIWWTQRKAKRVARVAG